MLDGKDMQVVADPLPLLVGPVVLDLGGKTFKGPLRGKPPHRLVLWHNGTVICNSKLQLRPDTPIMVLAKGCRMEALTVQGPGGTCDRAFGRLLAEHRPRASTHGAGHIGKLGYRHIGI